MVDKIPEGAKVESLPADRYAPDIEHRSAEVELPKGYLGHAAFVDRSQWVDPAITVSYFQEISLDGVEWIYWGGWESHGGDVIAPDGSVAPASYIKVDIPDFGVPVKFRSSMTVKGGSLNTKCEIIAQAKQAPPPIETHRSIAYTGQTAHAEAGAITAVVTPGITTSANNAIAIGGLFYNTTFTSFTDSRSNAFGDSGLGTISDSGAGTGKARAAYNSNLSNSGAGHTFTLTTAAASFPTIFVMEISGQDTTDMLDKTASLATSSATTHTSASTATTSQANELLFFNGGQRLVVATNTPDASYTGLVNVADAEVGGYKNVTATGTYNYSYTSANACSSAGILMTFKEAASAGTRVPLRSLLGVGL